jgi:hypothetical protein
MGSADHVNADAAGCGFPVKSHRRVDDRGPGLRRPCPCQTAVLGPCWRKRCRAWRRPELKDNGILRDTATRAFTAPSGASEDHAVACRPAASVCARPWQGAGVRSRTARRVDDRARSRRERRPGTRWTSRKPEGDSSWCSERRTDGDSSRRQRKRGTAERELALAGQRRRGARRVGGRTSARIRPAWTCRRCWPRSCWSSPPATTGRTRCRCRWPRTRCGY